MRRRSIVAAGLIFLMALIAHYVFNQPWALPVVVALGSICAGILDKMFGRHDDGDRPEQP